MGPRYTLNNSSIVAAGELFNLAPGVYRVSTEDTTYLPERWGTLIHFRSDRFYGTVIFLTTHGMLYYRHYTLSDNTWHTNWQANAKVECKSAEFGIYEGGNNSFIYGKWHDNDGFYQLQFYTKATKILLRYYNDTTHSWTDLWEK